MYRVVDENRRLRLCGIYGLYIGELCPDIYVGRTNTYLSLYYFK